MRNIDIIPSIATTATTQTMNQNDYFIRWKMLEERDLKMRTINERLNTLSWNEKFNIEGLEPEKLLTACKLENIMKDIANEEEVEKKSKLEKERNIESTYLCMLDIMLAVLINQKAERLAENMETE